MGKFPRSLRGVAVAALLAAAPISFAGSAYALKGDVKLPAPYLSRALDAVLLPIDATVRKVFRLGAKEEGVLVLSVEPGGVADKKGLEPGDVISNIKGHKVRNPIDVDTVVYYWLTHDGFDFLIDYYRAGTYYNLLTDITLDLFNAAFDMGSIASWQAWSTETSFTYSEFYSEYSETIVSSYESSETIIQETASSEDFAAQLTNEAKDTDRDGTLDGADTDDDNDGIEDTADADDDGDGVEEPADADDDGIPDGEDMDADNDGVDDADDTDDDNDGVDDSDEPDSDGDGISDDLDADDDGDGIDDAADTDDDGDGVDDTAEEEDAGDGGTDEGDEGTDEGEDGGDEDSGADDDMGDEEE